MTSINTHAVFAASEVSSVPSSSLTSVPTTAKRLHRLVKESYPDVRLAQCQEWSARLFGYRDFHDSQQAGMALRQKEGRLSFSWANASREDFLHALFSGVDLDLSDDMRNAHSLLGSALIPLLDQRDRGEFCMTPQELFERLKLDSLCRLWWDKNVLSLCGPLHMVLQTLPGFEWGKVVGGKEPKETFVAYTRIQAVLSHLILNRLPWVQQGELSQQAIVYENEQKSAAISAVQTVLKNTPSSWTLSLSEETGVCEEVFSIACEENSLFDPHDVSRRGLSSLRNFLKGLLRLNDKEADESLKGKIKTISRGNIKKEIVLSDEMPATFQEGCPICGHPHGVGNRLCSVCSGWQSSGKDCVLIWMPELSQGDLAWFFRWGAFIYNTDMSGYLKETKLRMADFFQHRSHVAEMMAGTMRADVLETIPSLLTDFPGLRIVPKQFQRGLPGLSLKDRQKEEEYLREMVADPREIAPYLRQGYQESPLRAYVAKVLRRSLASKERIPFSDLGNAKEFFGIPEDIPERLFVDVLRGLGEPTEVIAFKEIKETLLSLEKLQQVAKLLPENEENMSPEGLLLYLSNLGTDPSAETAHLDNVRPLIQLLDIALEETERSVS